MIAKCLLVTALASVTFGQGSLTPPSGPAPSMKTLGQIEPRVVIEKLPFKISAAGAYYLATNLLVPTGLNGITVDANQVTLDLNGFAITGAPDSEAAVSIIPGRTDITIRNGAISAAGTGIEATAATHIQLEGIRVTKCAGSGITVGADSVINNCTVSESGATGIRAGVNSSVANCQANGNGGNGIEADQKSSVKDCVVARNAFSGVTVGDFSKVIAVIATDNSGFGLNGGLGVHITDCTSNANRQHGINSGRLASVSRASACWNAQGGINVEDGSTVLDSSGSGNALFGITTGISAHVANCKADANGGVGIQLQKGSTVRDCSVQRNANDGISVTDQCVVLRNNANNNVNLKGAAGIHVRGTDNTIQENTAVSNDRGFALEVEGNLVIKNSATNNTLNFFVSGDQMMGPVINTFDGGDPTNPMSNFIY